MELAPTLISRLGPLEPWVLDSEVSEILIAGPNDVSVTRGDLSERIDIEFDENALRALASRLSRELARSGSHGTRSGLIATDLFVGLIGAAGGAGCPVIRFRRRPPLDRTLDQLAREGWLDHDSELRLLDACRHRRSIVITGHAGSGRTELLAALARVWKKERRVAVLDVPDGLLTRAGIGHVHLDPAHGARAALLVGAEVVVLDEPAPSLWGELLQLGRPILATVEAPDAQSALDRIIALSFSKTDTSQIATAMLVESSIRMMVEMERMDGRKMLRSIAEPERLEGRLAARDLIRPLLNVDGPPMSRTPDLYTRPPTQGYAAPVVGFETADVSEVSEIRAESLMSASFVGRLPQLDPAPATTRSPSERAPTLIGRTDSGELKTSSGSKVASKRSSPDEMTMSAAAGEMTLGPLEAFDDKSWNEALHDADMTDGSRGFDSEQTPYAGLEQAKQMNEEEVDALLSDLEEVVHLDDGDDKSKRRSKKA